MPTPAPSLKVRALKWLAQREHSRQELRQRLLRLAATPAYRRANADADAQAEPSSRAEAVETLLDWLVNQGWLSDERFVANRLTARAGRFGTARIEAELRQHGVQADAAQRQELRQTELARATELWRRRYGQPAGDVATRLRQMRFLAGRGFSSEVVRQVLGPAASTGLDQSAQDHDTTATDGTAAWDEGTAHPPGLRRHNRWRRPIG